MCERTLRKGIIIARRGTRLYTRQVKALRSGVPNSSQKLFFTSVPSLLTQHADAFAPSLAQRSDWRRLSFESAPFSLDRHQTGRKKGGGKKKSPGARNRPYLCCLILISSDLTLLFLLPEKMWLFGSAWILFYLFIYFVFISISEVCACCMFNSCVLM